MRASTGRLATFLAFAGLALLLGACTTTWTRLDQPALEGPGGRYRIEAPVGWVRYSLAEDRIRITRDGMAIQFIEVALLPPEKVFEKTKRKAIPDLPSELAELVLAELRGRAGLANLVVVENTPAELAGASGFRVRIRYTNERGAAFERVVTGAPAGSELLLFSYHALSKHFFDRDLPTFEAMIASYRPGKPR